MKNRYLIRITVICMAVLMIITSTEASAATLLKRGSRSTEVKNVQKTLKELGYYTYPTITGYYGSTTERAVKRFQKAMGVSADGIVGNKTRALLNRDEKLDITKNNAAKQISVMGSVSVQAVSGGALDWFKEVRYIWKKGENAIVTDVDTGLSFEVKRTYGTNHADIEPLTKNDTNTIKEIWGGFSWTRRAVIVQIGDYTLAGSMSAMPHAGVDSAPAGKYVRRRSCGYGWGANLDAVKNNGANGVMDLHFKNSRTHTTNTLQKSMQDMVKKAAEFIGGMYIVTQ